MARAGNPRPAANSINATQIGDVLHEQHAARDGRVLEGSDPGGKMRGEQDARPGRAGATLDRADGVDDAARRKRHHHEQRQARPARRRWRAAAPRRAGRRSPRPRRRAARSPARHGVQSARSRRPVASSIDSGDDPGRHFAPAAREGGVEFPPARLVCLHELPETPRMVQVPGVGEFVDEQVGHHVGRLEQEAGIQADGAVPRTTAPSGPLAPDLQPREAKPRFRWTAGRARARGRRVPRASRSAGGRGA